MRPLLLSNYLLQLPVLAVFIVGLIIAISRRRDHPRVSLWSTIAISIFSLKLVAGPIIRGMIEGSDAGLAEIGLRFAIYNVASSLLSAGAWALILMAIFRWRRKGSSQTSGLKRRAEIYQ